MSWKENKYSYSAASTIPMKLLLHPDLVESCVNNNKIIPLHLQLNPTNKCPFDCPACSCSARDRNLELNYDTLLWFLQTFRKMGGKSVTITGGGEPTTYSDFKKMVWDSKDMGLELGLVTNGTLFHRKDVSDVLGDFTWVRISSSDHLQEQLESIGSSLKEWYGKIDDTVLSLPKVDWAFSHIVERKENFGKKMEHFKKVSELVKFADEHRFTHVRLVNDIFVADELEGTMKSLKDYLVSFYKLDVSKVNFQGRSDWTRGTNPCYLSLLKPVLGADGFLYPCCIEENEPTIVIRENVIHSIPIRDVEIGDMIPDNGEVIAKYRRTDKASLEVTLKQGRSVIVATDHTMLVGKDVVLKDKPSIRHAKEVSTCSLIEVKANELKAGDLLPVLLDAPISVQKKDIGITLSRIMGYYVAEGWFDHKKKQIGFMFGHTDLHLDDLLECLKQLDICYKIYDRRTGFQVMVYNSSLFPYIEACGSHSHEKQIPTILFNATDIDKKEFIKAYLRGDGHVYSPTRNYNGFKIQFSTISRKLANDLILLLSQLGVYGRIRKEKRVGVMKIEGRTVNVKDIYRINVAGYYNLENIKEVLDIPISRGLKSQKRAIAYPRFGNLMFLPVETVEPSSGKIFYDLTISNSHRFYAGMGNILVKNCGVQYALESPARDYEKTMRMGSMFDFEKIINDHLFFDGSVCSKCFYDNYNETLDVLVRGLKHRNFV